MMNPDLNNKLIIIECILINEEIPDYIEISYQNNFIYCLIAKEDYKHQSLSERIIGIFEVLTWNCPDILAEYSIIVETLDTHQLNGLFEFYAR